MINLVSLSHWGMFAEDYEQQAFEVEPCVMGGISYGKSVITKRLNPILRPLTYEEMACA